VKVKRGDEIFMMHTGQEVELTKEKKFRLVKDVNVEDEIAWTEQEFIFENRNIFQMMNQIGAFYNYPVHFTDPLPDTNTKVIGRIPIFENPDSTKVQIEVQYDVSIKIRNDSFIVSGK
jgi:ferric-dicitrate binding protein FerR (iron transport regulator)